MKTTHPPGPDLTVFAQIPAFLVEGERFVLWKRSEFDAKGKRLRKATKLPYSARTRRLAKSDQPETWATWSEALDAYVDHYERFSGIGRMFHPDDHVIGFDFDNSLDDDGNLLPWARKMFDPTLTYSEVSPSFKGIKGYTWGNLPGEAIGLNQKELGPGSTGGFEVYDRLRFFALTGQRYHESPAEIADCSGLIIKLYEKFRRLREPTRRATVSDELPENVGDKVKRCRAYLEKCPASVPGSGGHDKCLRAACECLRFDLSDTETWDLMRWWSDYKSDDEPWNDKELAHKIASAHKKVTGSDVGSRLREERPDNRHNGNGQSNGNGQDQPCPDFDSPEDATPPPKSEAEAETKASSRTVEFPDPIPLDARALPPLPEGVFHGTAADMIIGNARASETPPELSAATLLSVIGTAVQKRISVLVEPGYFEPLNLYTITGMDVGSRKTAGQRPMIEPLLTCEERNAGEVAQDIEKLKSARKTVESRITRMRADAAKAKPEQFEKLKAEIEEMEATLPEVPNVPQLIVQDVTSENLATLLDQNGERMGMFSDEAGFFETIAGRYSSGVPNLDIILQAHVGAFVRVNRGSRPPVMLKHPALSIGLAIQPDVVRGLTDKPGFRGRGLLARFLYFLPDPRIGYRKHKTVPLSDEVRHAYEELVTRLADMPPKIDENQREVPRVLKLSDGAHTVWKAFQCEAEVWLRDDERLEHAKDWGNKLPGHVARIAGLLHCCDFFSDPLAQPEIDERTMERAVLLGRFLVDHALAAFDLMGASGGLEIARHLWNSIESRAEDRRTQHEAGTRRTPPNIVTLRDMWHPLRRTYRETRDVEPGIRVLCDHGHVVELPTPDYGKPGRRRKFEINPKLSEKS